MTITQLETFLKIAETRNFTTSASLLGYAQSTVTMQIKQLEEELGCLLFERLGKTVALTAEGERLCEYAAKMTQLEREIRLEVPTVKEPAGILRLGVSESLCYQGLPKVLLKYKQQYPKVEIQLSFIMHDTFPATLKGKKIVQILQMRIHQPRLEKKHGGQNNIKKQDSIFTVTKSMNPTLKKLWNC